MSIAIDFLVKMRYHFIVKTIIRIAFFGEKYKCNIAYPIVLCKAGGDLTEWEKRGIL